MRALRKAWIAAPAPLVFGSTMWFWPKPPVPFILAEYVFALLAVVVAVVAHRRR